MKIKSAGTNPTTPVYYIVNQILYPLVQGCESKDLKIIKVTDEFFFALILNANLMLLFSLFLKKKNDDKTTVLPWNDATANNTASG